MMFSLPRVIAAALAILLIPHLSSGLYVAIVGAAYLLWAPIPPRWTRRRRWVDLRFYSGARADEVPRAVVIGGVEEPVDVLGSWHEELAGARESARRRRFRLRVADASRLDVSRADGQARWLVERELLADLEGSEGQRKAANREGGQ